MDRLHGGRCSRLDKALVLAAVRVGREYRAREADFAKLLDGKSPATISISKRVGRCRNRSVRIAGFSAVSPRRSFSSKSAHLNGYRFSFAVKQFGTNANPPRTFSLPSSGVSLSESSSPSPRRPRLGGNCWALPRLGEIGAERRKKTGPKHRTSDTSRRWPARSIRAHRCS
jgi:hypothetical protein